MIYAHPQIYPHLKAIFCHVPKVAGTAIENALKAPGQTVGGHSTALGYRRKFPTEFATYFKFAFVREPVDRFLSAYYYLKQRGEHLALYNRSAHEAATPDEFCAILTVNPEIAKKMVHIWPQWKFICNEDASACLVDAVCPFEKLEESWKFLSAKLGIKFRPLPHSNRSRRPVETPSEAVKAFVAREYARDFSIFGYKLPA